LKKILKILQNYDLPRLHKYNFRSPYKISMFLYKGIMNTSENIERGLERAWLMTWISSNDFINTRGVTPMRITPDLKWIGRVPPELANFSTGA
jgi:hypothetical protein